MIGIDNVTTKNGYELPLKFIVTNLHCDSFSHHLRESPAIKSTKPQREALVSCFAAGHDHCDARRGTCQATGRSDRTGESGGTHLGDEYDMMNMEKCVLPFFSSFMEKYVLPFFFVIYGKVCVTLFFCHLWKSVCYPY